MATGKRTVNKVILAGFIGNDPEVKYTPNGQAVASFNLATKMGWKDKDGNRQEKDQWTRIKAWGKDAERIGEWWKKGMHVYVEGRLETRDYDKDGVKTWITEVIVEKFETLDKKSDGSDLELVSVKDKTGNSDNANELPF